MELMEENIAEKKIIEKNWKVNWNLFFFFFLERNLICMLVLIHSLFPGYSLFVCYFSLQKHLSKYWGIKCWLKWRANEDWV